MSSMEKHRAGPFSDLLAWLEDTGLTRVSEREVFPVVRIEDFVEDQTYVLRAEIPGVDPANDIEVTIEDDLLTVSGHKREESKDKNHQEIRYGEFSRSVTIPRDTRAEDITAGYTDGVLEVRMPMKDRAEESGSKRVPVQRGGAPQDES